MRVTRLGTCGLAVAAVVATITTVATARAREGALTYVDRGSIVVAGIESNGFAVIAKGSGVLLDGVVVDNGNGTCTARVTQRRQTIILPCPHGPGPGATIRMFERLRPYVTDG